MPPRHGTNDTAWHSPLGSLCSLSPSSFMAVCLATRHLCRSRRLTRLIGDAVRLWCLCLVFICVLPHRITLPNLWQACVSHLTGSIDDRKMMEHSLVAGGLAGFTRPCRGSRTLPSRLKCKRSAKMRMRIRTIFQSGACRCSAKVDPIYSVQT